MGLFSKINPNVSTGLDNAEEDSKRSDYKKKKQDKEAAKRQKEEDTKRENKKYVEMHLKEDGNMEGVDMDLVEKLHVGPIIV